MEEANVKVVDPDRPIMEVIQLADGADGVADGVDGSGQMEDP